METQKYTININLYREIISTKMKHYNFLVSVILLFINEHYRKKQIKGKSKKQITKQKTVTTKKEQK